MPWMGAKDLCPSQVSPQHPEQALGQLLCHQSYPQCALRCPGLAPSSDSFKFSLATSEYHRDEVLFTLISRKLSPSGLCILFSEQCVVGRKQAC